jgi:hypothetical protein
VRLRDVALLLDNVIAQTDDIGCQGDRRLPSERLRGNFCRDRDYGYGARVVHVPSGSPERLHVDAAVSLVSGPHDVAHVRDYPFLVPVDDAHPFKIGAGRGVEAVGAMLNFDDDQFIAHDSSRTSGLDPRAKPEPRGHSKRATMIQARPWHSRPGSRILQGQKDERMT